MGAKEQFWKNLRQRNWLALISFTLGVSIMCFYALWLVGAIGYVVILSFINPEINLDYALTTIPFVIIVTGLMTRGIPLCVTFMIGVLGLIVGVWGLIQIRKNGKGKGELIAIVGLLLSFAGMVISVPLGGTVAWLWWALSNLNWPF